MGSVLMLSEISELWESCRLLRAAQALLCANSPGDFSHPSGQAGGSSHPGRTGQARKAGSR